MKEYTLLALIFTAGALALDHLSGVKLVRRKTFFLFLAVILVFKFLVNGYLTGNGIVRYNPAFFLGLRIGSIPVEDFLFGFGMITVTIVSWELFKRK